MLGLTWMLWSLKAPDVVIVIDVQINFQMLFFFSWIKVIDLMLQSPPKEFSKQHECVKSFLTSTLSCSGLWGMKSEPAESEFWLTSARKASEPVCVLTKEARIVFFTPAWWRGRQMTFILLFCGLFCMSHVSQSPPAFVRLCSRGVSASPQHWKCEWVCTYAQTHMAIYLSLVQVLVHHHSFTHSILYEKEKSSICFPLLLLVSPCVCLSVRCVQLCACLYV